MKRAMAVYMLRRRKDNLEVKQLCYILLLMM